MLEEATVLCPYCQSEIRVKIVSVGSKSTYIADAMCASCGKSAAKIETALNRSNTKSKFKVEKSYIKLDPRG